MPVSVQSETDEMARAFKDFISTSLPAMPAWDGVEGVSGVGFFTSEDLSEKLRGLGLGVSGTAMDNVTDFRCGAMTGMAECRDLKGCRAGDPDSTTMDWRADPSRSGSDWTLVVYDGKDHATYSVHTLVLSYGPRRSEYFARLFDKKRLAAAARGAGGVASRRRRGEISSSPAPEDEKDPTTTEVYLPKASADAFPQLLDYVYRNKLELETSNAAALRHLSKHFSVQSLHETVSSFLRRDLSVRTAPSYLVSADAIMDRDLTDAAMRICAERIEKVSPMELPPKLMADIVTSSHIRCPPNRLSGVIAAYLRAREDGGHGGVNDEQFYWLTQPRVLPTVGHADAMFYLSFGQTRHPAVLHEGGEVSLKCRCIESLAGEWGGVPASGAARSVEERNGRMMGTPDKSPLVGKARAGVILDPYRYNSLPADIKLELLEASLLAAKREVEDRWAGTEGSASGSGGRGRGSPVSTKIPNKVSLADS